jgi:hypothetical protein
VRCAMAATVARRVLQLVQQYHVTEAGRPITLEHQWQDVYADPSTDMRIVAPAQRGKTLYELVKTMAQVSLGLAVGWVMPKDAKVQELVHGKLNPTIANTELYEQLQKISGGNDSVRFKTFGKHGRLYLVTANSESELTSFSADCMHIDERDFCNRQNLPMYPSRMNFSPYKLTDECSTPTVDGSKARVGQFTIDNIHSEFLGGDQHRYHVECPWCGFLQILDWYENIVTVKQDESGRIESFDVMDKEWSPGSQNDLSVACRECKRPFDRTTPGRWISLNPQAKIRSRWIESLNSTVGLSMEAMLTKFGKALGNPTKMQQFHNMDLGRPYAGGLMRFNKAIFERCVDHRHHLAQTSDGPCTIGIDVNRPWLDVHVSRWVKGEQVKVFADKIQSDEKRVSSLVKRFGITGGVIDQQPETTFATRLQERVYEETGCWIVRCKYATQPDARDLTISEAGDNPKLDPPRLITVNRTGAIDDLYESMLLREVVWFAEWESVLDGALAEEFKNPVRKLTVNDTGNERFSWEGTPDHQLHAAVYDLLAGKVLEMNLVRDYSEIGPVMSPIAHQSPMNPVTAMSRPSRDMPVIMQG